MAYLDIYPNPNQAAARQYPFVVEVQAELLSDMPTAVVIPLGFPDVVDDKPVLRLNPVISLNDTKLILMTQALAAIHKRQLKPSVGNLSARRDEIIAALDMLFTGF